MTKLKQGNNYHLSLDDEKGNGFCLWFTTIIDCIEDEFAREYVKLFNKDIESDGYWTTTVEFYRWLESKNIIKITKTQEEIW